MIFNWFDQIRLYRGQIEGDLHDKRYCFGTKVINGALWWYTIKEGVGQHYIGSTITPYRTRLVEDPVSGGFRLFHFPKTYDP